MNSALRLLAMFSCMLFMASSCVQAQTPTYCEKVAPILFKNCISCHRSGEIGPFALTTYDETVRHASTIKSQVLAGQMPPWKAAENYGHFVNERRLGAVEKQIIVDWVDGGMPQGDPNLMPPLPNFPQGSQLGTPDLVLRLPLKWKIQGNNEDVYRNFVIPTGLLQDRMVAAIEVRPDNRKVVHHVLMWNDTSGTARKLDAADSLEGYLDYGGPGFDNPVATYPGWAPGAATMFYPEGIALRMYKNSDLIVQMHYAPSGSDEEDQTTINVFFKDDPTARVVREGSILPDYLIGGYNAFVMPPNKVSSFKAAYVVTADISALAVFPHMHKLGVHNKLYAVTPKKDTIPLINIPQWDFNWQGQYSFDKLTKIPKSSKVYYEATYDNTSDNPFNPNDPPQLVQWGFKTTEEMYLCYLFYIPYRAGDENISQATSVEDGPRMSEPSPIDLKGINPNPAGTTATLDFRLFESKSLDIDIVDLEGRSVLAVAHAERFDAGQRSLRIDVGALASGLYLCRISMDNKLISTPFRVVH